MRQYQINELTKEERSNIDSFLKRNATTGSLDGLYWLFIPDDLLSSLQFEHKTCGPFHFGVELGEDFVLFEMLVRSAVTLHCQCIGYATRPQRDFLSGFIERMIDEEKIKA